MRYFVSYQFQNRARNYQHFGNMVLEDTEIVHPEDIMKVQNYIIQEHNSTPEESVAVLLFYKEMT